MSSTSSKWLMGCGIGCGVVILLIVIVVGVGYFFIRDTVKDFKETEASMDMMEDRYGDIRDFSPDPQGRIAPDRMEAFLSVRDSTAWLRDEMERSLQTISDDIHEVTDDNQSFWRVLGIIRRGVGAIPQVAEYYTTRNYALLDKDMALGEYYYIYTIAYYAWLKKMPEDGPDFRLMGDDERGRYRWYEDDEFEDEGEAEAEAEEEDVRDRREDDVREERRYRIIRTVRRMVIPMMRNQLAKLEEDRSIRYSRSWRRSLENELETLREDRVRLPWEDGLPEVIASSFRPYRDRLEASYNQMLNPLELMTE